MSVYAEDHHHVITGHHGKTLDKLEHFAEGVAGPPLPVVLPYELWEAGEQYHKPIRQSQVKDESVHARFTSSVVPEPEEHPDATNGSKDHLHVQHDDSALFVKLRVCRVGAYCVGEADGGYLPHGLMTACVSSRPGGVPSLARISGWAVYRRCRRILWHLPVVLT